ncbi:uncharacterized protein [Littorina saxatilis]|uniref:uncharacterized protein n=1 Tax=Littorina saxatilis TaxID=31220 RepID=UPI0038B5457A
MVVRQLCSLVRQQGVRLRAYLDDWLILNQDREACSAHTRLTLCQAHELGFSVNQAKSELTPSQSFTYLGMRFHTVDWSVRPSQRRIDKLQNLVKSLVSQKQAPVRELASVLGQMESMATLVPLGRVHKRPFQAALSSVWNPASQGWQVSVQLDSWFQQTTAQWLEPWISQGVLITPPPPEEDLFTDASLSGWGAHLSHHTASGTWTSGQALSHINVLELEAVAQGLQSFLPLVAGKHVRLHTDNTTVAAYINRQGGSRSHTLSLKACQLLKWCHQHQIRLSAKYLPGKLNVLADSLSRSSKVLHREWTITHHALQRLWVHVEKPMVDLFATRFSRRLPVFISPFPDPEAWKVNALEVDWTGLSAYAFPPFQLLGKVLRKAELEQLSLVLVAPMWTSQHWFPDLLRLAEGPPIPLNLEKGELLQPRTGIQHANPQSLRLHACRSLRLSGASERTLDLVQKAHRKSTSSVYASHWTAWVKWCAENQVNSVGPRSLQQGEVAKFTLSQALLET